MSDLKFEAAGVLGMGLVSALFATTRMRRVGAEHFLRFRERGAVAGPSISSGFDARGSR